MREALYIAATFIRLVLIAVNIAMLLRVVVELLFQGEESPFLAFLAAITEVFVMPFRMLLSRFRFVQECPIDIPFFVTALVLSVLQSVLPVPTL